MSEIFIVYGYTDYEGSDVICAFESEFDAIDFAGKCTSHESSRPEYPLS